MGPRCPRGWPARGRARTARLDLSDDCYYVLAHGWCGRVVGRGSAVGSTRWRPRAKRIPYSIRGAVPGCPGGRNLGSATRGTAGAPGQRTWPTSTGSLSGPGPTGRVSPQKPPRGSGLLPVSCKVDSGTVLVRVHGGGGRGGRADRSLPTLQEYVFLNDWGSWGGHEDAVAGGRHDIGEPCGRGSADRVVGGLCCGRVVWSARRGWSTCWRCGWRRRPLVGGRGRQVSTTDARSRRSSVSEVGRPSSSQPRNA